MTQFTETVSQRAREAAASVIPLTNTRLDVRKGLRDGHPTVQAFARFERELSTNKDETIAKLREALSKSAEGWENAIEFGLLPRQHFPAARILAEDARTALTSTKKEG